MERIFRVLTRKKTLDPIAITDTRLARVLNVYDLTALGIGSTLGVGVYVLAGQVAKETAGPSVVLSFLIAAIASLFAGLCYAEFGSRVPRAGSAYIYSYVTVGEMIAFIIGWNLILEYVIGSASVARGLSHYLDTLINHTLEDTFREIAPINVSFMSEYFDFFSFGLSVILAAALAFGMRESSLVNNIFTVLNILVIGFIIIAGAIKANPDNWSLPAPTNSSLGTGGFFPFGVSGMIKGAATCFYGFVGFDCIATTGEEVKNPQTAIPIAIMVSLMVVFLAYFGTSTVVTLMVPYYLQDETAPIPHAFAEVGWDVAKWIVAIGAMFGLCASLFGAMFPLPRIIYAMASDGIIFKFLGWVNERFRTPLIGTLLAGLLTGIMSALFDLGQLVNMMSIGTLLAYTIVAVCVLSLRYTENDEMGNVINSDSSIELIDPDDKITFTNLLKQSFNFQKLQNPTKTSQFLVNFAILFYVLLCLTLALCIKYLQEELKHAQIWTIILFSILGLFMILIVMLVAAQPISKTNLRFRVPFVPLIPALSILVNIYLMIMLDVNTWIRFGVWMAVGLPMYLILIRKCTISSKPNKLMHAKVDGVKTNGYLHNGGQEFIHYNGNVKDNNRFNPSPVLTYAVNDMLCSPSVDNLNVDNALAAFDDMLSKEEAVVVSESSFNRRVSIDTVSNASNVHSEESIVALIHKEDAELNGSSPILKVEEATDGKDDLDKTDVSISEPVFVIPPPPPPPPPMSGFEKFKAPVTKLKKISQDDMLHKEASTSKKPEPIKRTLSQPEIAIIIPSPVAEQSRRSSIEQSRRSSIIEDVDDNVGIGSKQHKKIVAALNKLFQPINSKSPEPKLRKPLYQRDENPVVSAPATVKLSVTKSEVENNNLVPPETLDKKGKEPEEYVFTPNAIKKKLDAIFRSDPRFKLSPLKKPNVDATNETNTDIPTQTEETPLKIKDPNESKTDMSLKLENSSTSETKNAMNKTPVNSQQSHNSTTNKAIEMKHDTLQVPILQPNGYINLKALKENNLTSNETNESKPDTQKIPIFKSKGYINLKALDQNGSTNYEEAINVHKDLMRNTLKSIKLRKISSVNA